jgi:hypothetical protein
MGIKLVHPILKNGRNNNLIEKQAFQVTTILYSSIETASRQIIFRTKNIMIKWLTNKIN